MSHETGPKSSSSPDTEPKRAELLAVADFDDMREKQKQLVMDALDKVNGYDKDAVEAAKAGVYGTFDERAKKMLIAKGAVTGEDDPTLAKKVAYVRHYSIDKMSEDKWLYDRVDDNGTVHPSGRQKVKEDFQHEAEKLAPELDPQPVPEPDPKPTDPEKTDAEKAEEEKRAEEEAKAKERAEKAAERDKKIEELEKKLGPLQGAKHAAFAKRMAVSWFRRKKKAELNEAYEQASKEYLETLEELETLKMDKEEEVLKEHGAYVQNEKINEDLQERFDKLLKGDSEAQRAELLKAGGWKAKVLERYANWGKGKRLLASLGMGALIAGGSAGLTILTGGVGLIAVLGGGASVGARSWKAYAMGRSRLYQKKDTDQLNFKLDDLKVDRKIALRQAIDRLKFEDDTDIESGDRKKRNAVLLGVGAAALGGAAGMYMSHAAESGTLHVSDRPSGWAGGKVGDMIAGPEDVPSPENAANAPEWSIDAVAETKPELPPEMLPTDYNLRPGAGFYEQFGKIPGIEKEHYHELWQAVGPKLAEMKNGFGQPLAYEMHGEPGNWGIRMTADGKMPVEAMNEIAHTYQEMFGGGVPTGGAEVAGDVVSAPDSVTLTEADANELKNVVKMDVISPDDVKAVIAEHPGLIDKLSHAAANVPAEQFAHHIGLPDQVWQNDLQKYIVTQLDNNNPLYTNAFYRPDNVVRFVGPTIPQETVVDLLAHIPKEVRESITVS